MSSPQNLLQEYTRVRGATSTEEVKAAENALIGYEKSPSFIADSAQLFLAQAQVPDDIRKLAAVQLVNHSKRILKLKNQDMKREAVKQFLLILAENRVKLEAKSFVSSALQKLLSSESSRDLKITANAEYKAVLAAEIAKQDKEVNFSLVVFFGLALIKNTLYTDQLKQLIKVSFEPITKLALRLLKIMGTLPPEAEQLRLMTLKLVSEFSTLIKYCMRKLGLLDVEATRLLYQLELKELICLGCEFSFPGNALPNSRLYYVGDRLISRLVNKIKSTYVEILTGLLRQINTYVKHSELLKSNPVYTYTPTLIEAFLKETQELLRAGGLEAIEKHSAMLNTTLEEVFNLFIATLRVHDFYPIYSNYKNDLLDSIILPVLQLTPKDVDDFYQDCIQFVHHTVQIVERDIKTPLMANYHAKNSGEEPVEQFETLKTYAAQLLNSICKYQDGCLSNLVEHAILVLENQIGGEGRKTLMLLVLCIINGQLAEREDLKLKVTQEVLKLMESVAVPVMKQGVRKEEDIEYCCLLLAFSKMIFLIQEVFPNVIGKTYHLGVRVAQSPTLNDAHKYFIFALFDEISRTQKGEQYALDILKIYNHLLGSCQSAPHYLLDSYFTLLKYTPDILTNHTEPVVECVQLLCQHMLKELLKPHPTQIYLNKCFNVVREVGESEYYIPKLIGSIEQAILPIAQRVDGVRNLDFEEDILLLITSFIERDKKVTIAQQQMFDIIPKIFYGQYECRFGHAFHTIQLFILHGHQLLVDSPSALKSILEMSMASLSTIKYKTRTLSESENAEGVLILHSLVLRCGGALTQEMLWAVVNSVIRRLEQPIKFHFLSANLYALLSLLLNQTLRFFDDPANDTILTRVLSNIGCFTQIEYAPKAVIVGLTELLGHWDAPFVARRYSQILDIVITLLQVTSMKKDNYFEVEEEQEEKEYGNLLVMLQNHLKKLDEFVYFKQQVEKIKQVNLAVLQQSVASFPETKRQFLMNILRVERVQNEPRQIYKIRRQP